MRQPATNASWDISDTFGEHIGKGESFSSRDPRSPSQRGEVSTKPQDSRARVLAFIPHEKAALYSSPRVRPVDGDLIDVAEHLIVLLGMVVTFKGVTGSVDHLFY